MNLTLRTWAVGIAKVGSLIIAVATAAMWLALFQAGAPGPGGLTWLQLVCHVAVAWGCAVTLEQRNDLKHKVVVLLVVGSLVNLFAALLTGLAIYLSVT